MTDTTPAKGNVAFTFDTVACLAAALEDSGVTLGNKHYAIMAQLDPARTASSFEHQFRKVKARAKELSKVLKAEGSGASTPKGKVASKPADSAETGTGKKRARGKAAVKTEETAGDDAAIDEHEEINGDETPAKKKAKTAGKKTPAKRSPTKKSPVKKETDVEDAKTAQGNIKDASMDGADNNGADIEGNGLGPIDNEESMNELFDFDHAAA